ncbi:MAG: hypothetical protein R3Y22_10175, partial [Bacteroidales bacterium]
VIVNSATPPTLGGTNVFYRIGESSGSSVLYVPAGCTAAYSSWAQYFAGGIYEPNITVKEDDGVLDLSKETVTSLVSYSQIVIEQYAEIDAEGNDNITLDELVIERTFEYAKDENTGGYVVNNNQWFNLGLPFEGVANSNYVQKYNEETSEYEPAVCGVDYATFTYNGERRATKEEGSTESNWDMLYAEDLALGELIQFTSTGMHKYRFISPSATEATSALKTGRKGSEYYNESKGDGGENGWNLVPAGKTYSTTNYEILDGLVSIQIYDGKEDKFTLKKITELEESDLTPGTVFGLQLLMNTDDNPTVTAATTIATTVEYYKFELVDSDGVVYDCIYLYDGSNHLKYRLGKMSSLNSSVAQMAIEIDGKSYCTYGTLASDTKSYTVSLLNADGLSLVMTATGSQTVTVDGSVANIDTPIAVEDGEIVIEIGSKVSSINSLTEDDIAISSANGAIYISGVEAGTTYGITSMSGITTYGTASGETTSIDKPAGVYIVQINNTVTKVVVK